MDPLTGLLAGAGTGIASGVMGLLGTNSANQLSQQEVVQQEQFQETMANSQYQRGVQDLDKAGLNPMLAYMSSAAPSPSGSVPQVQNPGPGLQQAVATAASTAQQQMQMSLNQASTAADVNNKLAQANAANAQAKQTSAVTPGKTALSGLESRITGSVNAILDKMNVGPSGASSAMDMLKKMFNQGPSSNGLPNNGDGVPTGPFSP